MKTNCFFLLFTITLLVGCSSEPKEFSYTFIMESVEVYKQSLTIDQSKQYTIEQQEIYFNLRANRYNPVINNGVLNDDDFNEFKKLLTASKLHKMKDSYGFDKEKDQALHDVIYYIIYNADKKEKSITVRLDNTSRYPASFTKLIDFTNQFISKNKGS